jgi:signal transduction histidine kinase
LAFWPVTAYSRFVGIRDLAEGVRGINHGPAHQWAHKTVVTHRVLACVAATAALYACAMTFAGMHQPGALAPAEVCIATVIYVAFAVVPLLHWPPWLPVATCLLGAFVSLDVGQSDALIGPALVVAVLVYAVVSEKSQAGITTAAVVLVLVAGHLLFCRHLKTGWADLAVLPWIVMAAAIGVAIKAKRAHEAMLAERARRAEEGREAEARRRVQEERLRIARDLHDAVGHQVALISVQAGAMSYLLKGGDLDKARESLAHIQQASESALEELRLTVGLLRAPGDQEPMEPAGGLARLGELIDSFTATGLRVRYELSGPVRPLPEAVDLTAYRVIQESLTNTAKHAAGAGASVRVVFRSGVLAVAIDDDGRTSDPAACEEGHGIIGMRERATALGGWLSAGRREDGGFRVLAELPLPAVVTASPPAVPTTAVPASAELATAEAAAAAEPARAASCR